MADDKPKILETYETEQEELRFEVRRMDLIAVISALEKRIAKCRSDLERAHVAKEPVIAATDFLCDHIKTERLEALCVEAQEAQRDHITTGYSLVHAILTCQKPKYPKNEIESIVGDLRQERVASVLGAAPWGQSKRELMVAASEAIGVTLTERQLGEILSEGGPVRQARAIVGARHGVHGNTIKKHLNEKYAMMLRH